jgi:hypothetical protein
MYSADRPRPYIASRSVSEVEGTNYLQSVIDGCCKSINGEKMWEKYRQKAKPISRFVKHKQVTKVLRQQIKTRGMLRFVYVY